MADNVTVDELAIKVAVSAKAAADQIDHLTLRLTALTQTLAPAMKSLQGVSAVLSSMKGASPAIRALEKTGTGATRTAAQVAKATAALGAYKRMMASTVARTNFTAAPLAPTMSATSAASVGASALNTSAATVAATAKSRTLLGAVQAKIKSVTGSIVDMGKRGAASNKLLGGSFIQLRSKIFFAFFIITALVGLFKTFIGNASSAIEKMNLFQVSFGSLASEANRYADSITSVLGIDPATFKETYATFYTMSRSLGMVAESANTVSKNFTQLVYDYSSLRELSFEDAAAKFRSAMAGQTRAVASLGLDVTLASLKEEALREGLTGNVAEFTKANKIILMHNLILRQSTVAQGDLARTLSSPSNMMRVLKDQFTIAARSIGYLFIPMLKAVLPWLIMLAQALNKAAQGFLALFGIQMPSWSDMGADLSDGATGADDLFEGLDNAAGAAKQLRDYTMGIDELNIIPQASGGGGGGGGVGGAGGAGIKPFDVYDMIGGIDALNTLLDPIRAKFDTFKQSIQPFLDAIGRLWEALKPFAVNVWTGFTDFYNNVLFPLTGWTLNTVGVAALDTLREILEWFNEHPKAAKLLGGVAAALLTLSVAIRGLSGLGKILGGLGLTAFLSDILVLNFGTGTLTTGLGNWLATLMAGGGFFATLATLLVEGIALLLSFGVGYLIGSLIANIPAVDKFLTKVGESLGNWYYDTSVGFETKTTEWGETLGTWWYDMSVGFEEKTTEWGESIATFVENVGYWWERLRVWTSEKWEGVKSTISKAWEHIQTTVINPIRTAVSNMWGGLTSGLTAAWNAVRTVFKSGVNSIISYINNGPIRLINTMLRGAARIPGVSALLGATPSISTIPYLAAGGMPTVGSMFVAGEAGAELIGSYGGNANTVMPLENSGFVEAMAAAVYSATVAALKSQPQGSGGGDVYIDGVKAGKVIKASGDRAGLNGGLVTIGAVG